MGTKVRPYCWVARVRWELERAGLRPTKQRLLIGTLLFRAGDRHVTAEQLHEEATGIGESISLATIYHALRQFSRAGIVRPIAVQSAKTYFDTNTSDHQHFYVEDAGRLIDIGDEIVVTNLPPAPAGMRIANVDVMVHLRTDEK